MSITDADAVLMLTITGLFDTPQQLQGFATDDIFDIPTIRSVETMMGVDGILTGGFVNVPIPQSITLMGDSASNSLFDIWQSQMKAGVATFTANGSIFLRSIATKYTMTKGFLTGYKPAPSAKRVLQPRQFEITWQNVAPAPLV